MLILNYSSMLSAIVSPKLFEHYLMLESIYKSQLGVIIHFRHCYYLINGGGHMAGRDRIFFSHPIWHTKNIGSPILDSTPSFLRLSV